MDQIQKLVDELKTEMGKSTKKAKTRSRKLCMDISKQCKVLRKQLLVPKVKKAEPKAEGVVE